jgi:hypothetical protein
VPLAARDHDRTVQRAAVQGRRDGSELIPHPLIERVHGRAVNAQDREPVILRVRLKPDRRRIVVAGHRIPPGLLIAAVPLLFLLCTDQSV